MNIIHALVHKKRVYKHLNVILSKAFGTSRWSNIRSLVSAWVPQRSIEGPWRYSKNQRLIKVILDVIKMAKKHILEKNRRINRGCRLVTTYKILTYNRTSHSCMWKRSVYTRRVLSGIFIGQGGPAKNTSKFVTQQIGANYIPFLWHKTSEA